MKERNIKNWSDSDLTRLREHPDAFRVFASRVTLKKEGNEYVSHCPFHQGDKDPSFRVHLYRRTWRWNCFGCNAVGGDVIDFVQRKDDLDFQGAVRLLSDELLVQKWQNQKETVEQFFKPIGEEKKYKTFTLADYAPREAALAASEPARKWLEDRGISYETAKRLRLGFRQDVGKLAEKKDADIADKGWMVFPRISRNTVVGLHFRSIVRKAFCRHPGMATELFNANTIDILQPVFVTEGEPDAAILEQAGYRAVSLASASIYPTPEQKDVLMQADEIILAGDTDEEGTKCMERLWNELQGKTYLLKWPEGCKDANEAFLKDCKGDVQTFRNLVEHLKQHAIDQPRPWRRLFKSRDEMEQGPFRFLIENFLPEGSTLIGALPGIGKTWFDLSMAKALTTGKNFLGFFAVPQIIPVLYLVPEMSERAFRVRMEKMGLDKNFLCRTAKDGLIELNDPELLAAVRDLKPVVLLDTIIRFSKATDENDAAQNRNLANAFAGLLHAGAQGVVGLHHSTKASERSAIPTLEEVIRGTGDLSAMVDAVYGLQCVDAQAFKIRVRCVKARDFEPVPPFEIQGRPYINEIGDFGVLEKPAQPSEQAEVERFVKTVEARPEATYRQIEDATGICKSRVAKVAAKAGWIRSEKLWQQISNESSQKPITDALWPQTPSAA
jgi:5S rRNA maturation endonuclease (ribonuclease M5)